MQDTVLVTNMDDYTKDFITRYGFDYKTTKNVQTLIVPKDLGSGSYR